MNNTDYSFSDVDEAAQAYEESNAIIEQYEGPHPFPVEIHAHIKRAAKALTYISGVYRQQTGRGLLETFSRTRALTSRSFRHRGQRSRRSEEANPIHNAKLIVFRYHKTATRSADRQGTGLNGTPRPMTAEIKR